MREILKLSAILLIICAILAGLLAYTNQLTAPIIAKANEESAKAARTEVLPEAQDFTQISDDTVASIAESIGLTTDDLNEIFEADANGEIIGYTFKCTVSGFGGDVVVLTGISTGGTIEGVRVLEQDETPGLGAKSTDADWISQYTGKSISSELTVIKIGTADDSEIVAITGATITSRAVTLAVNHARSAFLELQGGAVQ
jgi:electron transport complex protein RnfG